MLPRLHHMPQLNTSFNEPLLFLERHFLSRHEQIQEWFKAEWQQTPPPVYGSVDLRNAGFKLAPIDMNLFPAGFNNLNPEYLPLYAESARKSITTILPDAKKILIIPEKHTRNVFYWENVAALTRVLKEAQFDIRIGSVADDASAPQTVTLQDNSSLIIEPLQRKGDLLACGNFVPDLVLLNNDLSDGVPEILQNISQVLAPPASLGWSRRLKSEHFQYYAAVAEEFSQKAGIDPWLIAPLFRQCGKIDFMQQEGLTCLAQNAEKLFRQIQEKYDQYNITQQPFLIVKADAGTYGMAVMTVRNIDELLTLNRKQRTKMATAKGSQPVRRVIIQEGVYTFETLGEEQAAAEPVVYLWGECVVGGFYRVHKERGIDESLNAPGMHFEPIAFSRPCNEPRKDVFPDASQNRFYTYGVVAQLSMLAAAREIKEQQTK